MLNQYISHSWYFFGIQFHYELLLVAWGCAQLTFPQIHKRPLKAGQTHMHSCSLTTNLTQVSGLWESSGFKPAGKMPEPSSSEMAPVNIASHFCFSFLHTFSWIFFSSKICVGAFFSFFPSSFIFYCVWVMLTLPCQPIKHLVLCSVFGPHRLPLKQQHKYIVICKG